MTSPSRVVVVTAASSIVTTGTVEFDDGVVVGEPVVPGAEVVAGATVVAELREMSMLTIVENTITPAAAANSLGTEIWRMAGNVPKNGGCRGSGAHARRTWP
jgi:hypothetical protein